MSVSKETYIVLGIKFGEEFTRDFWNSEFYPREEYFDENNKLKFLSDGMNGDYTFFGQIIELCTGGDWYSDEIKDLDLENPVSREEILEKFRGFYPDFEVSVDDIKLYYVPHYV